MDKQRKPGEEQQAEPGAGPEELFKWRGAVPDEQDAEGHGIRWGRAVPEDEAPGPDEGIRQRVDGDDDETPGPDEGMRWK